MRHISRSLYDYIYCSVLFFVCLFLAHHFLAFFSPEGYMNELSNKDGYLYFVPLST